MAGREVRNRNRNRNRSRKRNSGRSTGVYTIQRRILVAFVIILVMFTALTFRVGWIQIVAAEQYASKAAEYQIKDERLTPTRGSILSRNMNELAISTVSYRLWARLVPATEPEIAAQDPATLETQKQYAAGLVSIVTGIPIEEIEAKLDTDEPLVRLASDLTKPEIELIREGINEKDITILEIEERSTRRYPLGSLAAKIVGSVNYDGHGQSGVELTYEEYLSGVTGRQIARTDSHGNAVIGGERAYYESQNGLNVVTTLDESIQTLVENAIFEGLEETQANRMMAIVYDPKTGDVLAMADTNPYDPNDPGRPMSKEDRKEFALLTPAEQTDYLSKMWRNPCISDVNDPGSLFKIITVSSALEDGSVTPESWFNCAGSLQIYEDTVRCWIYPSAHGGQTVREAVANSCNPVMMQIVQALGYDRFYNYLELFGITEKTGIDLPGEENPLLVSKREVSPVDLATMSFGQGLSVTPIQMVSAIGAVANDGKLMVPRVVKGLADDEGNMVEEFAPKIKRQVISEKTASEMLEILQYVSEYQPSSAARISGYNIGIKTGTTEKLVDGEYSKYTVIGSMMLMAPIEDPEFVVLVLCDTPRVGLTGLVTAGPTANKIAVELLRYMNIRPVYSEEEIEILNEQKLTVADYTGWSLGDARASLDYLKLQSNIGIFLGDEPEEADEDGDAGDGGGVGGGAGGGGGGGSDGLDGDSDGDDEGEGEGMDADEAAKPEDPKKPERKYPVDGLDRNLTVIDQYPKPGMKVSPGGTVFLYWE